MTKETEMQTAAG